MPRRRTPRSSAGRLADLGDRGRRIGCRRDLHARLFFLGPAAVAAVIAAVLALIAQGDSNKVWIIPSEFANALGKIGEALPGAGETTPKD